MMENKSNITYINIQAADAQMQLNQIIHGLLQDQLAFEREVVILCIGTDRATGDSLGPLVGYKLIEAGEVFDDTYIYGTLEAPIHAKNLKKTVDIISNAYKNPVVIAIDASLGKFENVGCLTIGKGAICPGAGMNKRLPCVGDIFITGIVNYTGAVELFVLQNTRLSLVMKMADMVTNGIMTSLFRLGHVSQATGKDSS